MQQLAHTGIRSFSLLRCYNKINKISNYCSYFSFFFFELPPGFFFYVWLQINRVRCTAMELRIDKVITMELL